MKLSNEKMRLWHWLMKSSKQGLSQKLQLEWEITYFRVLVTEIYKFLNLMLPLLDQNKMPIKILH
jgi:hypothetical protein